AARVRRHTQFCHDLFKRWNGLACCQVYPAIKGFSSSCGTIDNLETRAMRSTVTVFAALIAASLVATPLVISASNALATPDHSDAVAMPAAVTPIEIVAMPAPVPAETCTRKVRVVYAGYGTDACSR
ncbi:hypothetical protein, partial [Methylobacterium goesingense]